jgi:hypothetical protein
VKFLVFGATGATARGQDAVVSAVGKHAYVRKIAVIST